MRELTGGAPEGPERTGPNLARLGLPLVVLGTAASGAAYSAALLPGDSPAWSPFGLAAGIGLLLSGLLLLGARRHGRVPLGLGLIFLGAGLWVSGGLAALLLLPGVDAADATLVLGLPRRTAFLLLGVGLAPGLVVPLAYGVVFDRETLTEADLAHLRETARRVAAQRDTG